MPFNDGAPFNIPYHESWCAVTVPLSDVFLLVVKSIVLFSIIFLAIINNSLVIISVILYRKLRHVNNYFLVSLAFADLFVAIFAMSFNATLEISGTVLSKGSATSSHQPLSVLLWRLPGLKTFNRTIMQPINIINRKQILLFCFCSQKQWLRAKYIWLEKVQIRTLLLQTLSATREHF